jgi:ribosome-associated protein
MKIDELREGLLQGEIKFSASRSSGPGGQNVNKVNTKVEARFNVVETSFLTPGEKSVVLEKLRTRINTRGELIVSSRSERSQFLNRKRAGEKIISLIATALTERKKRLASTPTLASRIRRIEEKKIHSKKKRLRERHDPGAADN